MQKRARGKYLLIMQKTGAKHWLHTNDKTEVFKKLWGYVQGSEHIY